MSDSALKKLERMIHVGYAALICLGVWLLLKYGVGMILPFLLALPLVALLDPLIKWIHRRLRIDRRLVSVLIVAILYVGIFGLLFLLGAQLASVLRHGIELLPGLLENHLIPALSRLSSLLNGLLDALPASWGLEIASFQSSLISGLQSLAGTISQGGVGLISSMTNAVPAFFMNLMVTIILSFLISTQYDGMIAFFRGQLPARALVILGELKGIARETVGGYLRAVLILICITFVELAIGLSLIGVDSPVLTATLIALFDAFPVFGTGGIMVPWVIIELVQGNFNTALWLGTLYLIVMVIRNAIEPKIIGDQLGLNPIVSLMAIYVGFKTLGVLGMITFPMLAQVLLSMHKRGLISLYHSAGPEEAPEEPQEIAETDIAES